MSERIDILEASREAISIELEKTRQVIAYLDHRAERLKKALAALEAAGRGGPGLPDAESVSRIMDQLQMASRPEGEIPSGADGEAEGESKVSRPASESPEAGSETPVPPWMFPGGEEKRASEKSA